MPTSADRIANLSTYVPQVVLRRLAPFSAPPAEPQVERFPAALVLVDITGFTPITASAAERGPEGVERFSRSFSAYLSQIIDLTVEHGGDIAKIVGDALIPIWVADDEDLPTVTRRAVACGLAIATNLGEVEMETELRLSLKVAVCAGEVATTHVGGIDGHWLFLMAGPGVAQLSHLEPHLQAGDVVASPEAWALVSDRFVGQPFPDGHVRIHRTDQTLPPKGLSAASTSPDQEGALRAFIPQVLLSRIDAGQADWLAEFRRTTVVFANVRGIGHETPDAVQLVHRLTQDAQRVLLRYDGWLKEVTTDDKGTTVIAVFGVPPFTHEDDAARAVNAALEIQAQIRELGLGAGVGVATGPTFSGPVGNAQRRDYAMLGSHVNLAARLMQASGDDGVLCDGATAEQARGRHVFERLPAYVLKGMAAPVDVYRTRPQGFVSGQGPVLVDRVTEMGAALATLDALRAGDGGLVTLEGEPGIGKSSIVGEWLRRARELEINTLVGAASDIDVSTPYSAWRAVFEQLLGVAAATDPVARRTLTLERLKSDEQNLRLAPLLAPILSIDLPDNEVTAQLSGAVRADNIGDLLIRLLGQEASKGPLIVVLEDVHWLDSASWSLVVRARREIPQLLLVLTTRPVADVQADPLGAVRSQATTVRVGALSRSDAVALAARRTGATQLAEPVARIVQERAEGNPLFIEQLTYAMRDAGLVVVDRGVLRAASGRQDLEGPIIPDTVQRVITTRLDQLPPTQAMTLKVASVIGERFAVRTLADIYPLATTDAQLMDDLETLTRLDLLAPVDSAPQPSYEFSHKITQEVAYNLMPFAQSRQLHRSLAEWYERTYAADQTPFHPFLAYQWRKADVPARAIGHLELAAGQALRTFANEEAIGFLDEALSLAADHQLAIEPIRRAGWHLHLGEAYVHLSRYREGRDHLELGLRLMGRLAPGGDWRRGAALVGQILRQLSHRAGLARSSKRLSDAQREELVAVCRAYERLAEASYYGGETLLPLYSSIRILNDAEASGSAPEIARGLAGTGTLFGLVPLPRIADSYLRRALVRLNEVDDLTTHEIVGIVVGFYQVGAAKWEQAREQFSTVRRIARRLGDRRRLHDALGNLAELEYLRGSFKDAAKVADELVAVTRARNDRRFEAEGLAVAAHCAWQLGKANDAYRLAGELKAIVAEEPEVHDELRIKYHGLIAMIHLSRGERALAIAACEEAMRLTSAARPAYFATFLGYIAPAEVYLNLLETGQPLHDLNARVAEAMARLHRYAGVFPIGRPRHAILAGSQSWLLGKRGDALRSWRRGLTIATDLSMPYEQGLAHYEIGRHLDVADAEREAHLRAAREIFNGLGAARLLEMLEAVAPPEIDTAQLPT